MNLELRQVDDKDLDIFFEHWKDPDANFMAAFTSKDPHSRSDFDNHWGRIFDDDEIIVRTIIFNDNVAGHIVSFYLEGERELSYWLGKEYWGRGITTNAVKLFLEIEKFRPLFARTARDNFASIKVLKNCGFIQKGESTFFANARGKEILEYIFELKN